MFRELLTIFRGESPLKAISQNFTQMLELARRMALEASAIYWNTAPQAEQVKQLRGNDIEVNKLERTIRKQLATHLAVHRGHDVPYCLLMMSLVKDVERLGVYSKNLVEAAELYDEKVPEDDLANELRDIRDSVEYLARQASRVFTESDRERATELTVEGRTVAKRCDDLFRQIAKADYDSGLAVKLTLGARYYKRIGGHLLNILSSVIMPLHKLDYYDEKALADAGVDYAD